MPTLIDRTGRIEDRWTTFEADLAAHADAGMAPDAAADVTADVASAAAPARPVPAGGRFILTLEQWAAHGEALLAAGASVGIRLEPAEGPEAIAHLLDRIKLVAVNFPSFTDGRGYSTARLLRQRHGWTGELRAVGDVLRDQMFYLSRCGFDTFELKDGESVEDALRAFRDFSEPYQEAADRGPLFRRRAEPAATAR